MILDIEFRYNSSLRISYFNENGNVEIKDYDIDEIKNWTLCGENDKAKDPNFRNWDGKPVKSQKSKYLNKWSIYEFIYNNPDKDILNALNYPKIYSIDIETEVIDGFPNPDIALERITTIAISTQDRNVIVLGWKELEKDKQKKIFDDVRNHMKDYGQWDFKYICFDDEYQMMNSFVNRMVPRMSLITGWNFMNFDWKYIHNRCKRLGIDLSKSSPSNKLNRDGIPLHIGILDYLQIYRRYDTYVGIKENNSLDFVANAVLGVNKIKYSGTLQELYEQDYDKYVFYNAIDSALVVEIHEKTQTLNHVLAVSTVCNTTLYKSSSAVNTTEALLWKKYYERGLVVADDFVRPSESRGYEGAYVKEPLTGFYKGVSCYDFASLYPSIMRQINISPESFIKKERSPEKLSEYKKDNQKIVAINGSIFHKKDSAMKEILSELYSQRKSFKKRYLQLEIEIQKLQNQL